MGAKTANQRLPVSLEGAAMHHTWSHGHLHQQRPCARSWRPSSANPTPGGTLAPELDLLPELRRVTASPEIRSEMPCSTEILREEFEMMAAGQTAAHPSASSMSLQRSQQEIRKACAAFHFEFDISMRKPKSTDSSMVS